MKTRIQIVIDMEVEIEENEEEALSYHHGWGNAIHSTYSIINQQIKEQVAAQFTEQHRDLLAKAKQNFPRYLSNPF